MTLKDWEQLLITNQTLRRGADWGVFSDWLEDEGDLDRAKGVRVWINKYSYVEPRMVKPSDEFVSRNGKDHSFSFDLTRGGNSKKMSGDCQIANLVFDELNCPSATLPWEYRREYPSRWAGMLDLWQALGKVADQLE